MYLPPHSVNISARVLCFSTTYPKREHFFEFFCGKEVCMESFSFDHKRSVGKRFLMLYLRPISIFISIPCNSNPRSHYHSRIFSRLTVLQMLTFFDKQVTLSKHCRILPFICSMRGIDNQLPKRIVPSLVDS